LEQKSFVTVTDSLILHSLNSRYDIALKQGFFSFTVPVLVSQLSSKCSGQKSLGTFPLNIWCVSVNAVLTVKTHGQTTEEGARLPREQQVLNSTPYTFPSVEDVIGILKLSQIFQGSIISR
jgi:hypothetical protein